VPVSVADLVKYYADAPPPRNDSLADLEARLEALISPAYRSLFKFEPASLSPLVAGTFGTPKYGYLGPYTSVADALKPPPVPDVASLYPLHRAAGLTKSEATTIPELFAQRYGGSSSPLWKQLAETRRLLSGSSGAFSLQNVQRTLEAIRLRPPFLYDALDAWEAFLEADIEALDRFIAEHLGRRPDDRTRLAVQQRLERAFGREGSPIPAWAGDPGEFGVGVFMRIQRQMRAEEAAKIDELQRLRDAGVDRVRMGFEEGLRLRKVMAQDLGLDHEQLSIDGKLKDHYVRVRFPGAVLVARDEKPHLPEMPSRKREPNLRSHTVTSVEQEAAEGIIKERVMGRPLEPTKHGDLAVPFDPKEDHTRPPSVVTDLREEPHIEVFEAQERERGRLNQLRDTMRRAGLSPGEEEVMRLRLEGLRNKDIAARLGCSAGQVGVQAWRGREKVREAARG
jgi:hypothetical protein